MSDLRRSDLRLYTFVNFYLSSIQQGIQSAHVVSNLFVDYRGAKSKAAKLLWEWAEWSKTMIVLNGGMAINIEHDFLSAHRAADWRTIPYPFTSFAEEAGAIHQERSACTAWGIVLPPEVYNAKPVEVFPSRVGFSALKAEELTTMTPIWEPGSFECHVCSYLQGMSLAR